MSWEIKMQITKDELIRELAEMENWKGRKRKFDDLPFHKKLTYITEAERFIKALNNIRRRRIMNDR